MKQSLKLMGLMTLTSTTALAGSLDPPSAPSNVNSGMYSLQAICDRLSTGAAGTQNAFTEPTSGPVATGCTLNDVMTKAPALDETNGATPADVATGKQFWGLKSGNWGGQTGTATAGASAAVPKTGQTTCYTVTGATTSCPGTGQDGELQKGIAWPDPRFRDNGNNTVTDGTVTDKLTGLIWLKNANCANKPRTWLDASSDVVSLNSAGTMNDNDCGDTSNGGTHQTDWRLPNRKELDSLIDLSRSSPALPTGYPFTGVQNNYYWSASSYANRTANAWVVNFNDGNVDAYEKMVSNYVWPVRGGQ